MTTIFRQPLGFNGICRGIAAACILLAAHASAAEAPPPGASLEGNNTELEEIVVSANRREEKLDKVPISISAFSQKTMDDLHIETFTDLASVVPGLVVSTPRGATTDVAVRGIFSGGNSPTTQFYIDETPVAIRVLNGAGPSGSPHPIIFDLDRVEVLRGPQGTLFGSSAMGGAIRYITPQPNLSDPSGYAKADMSYTDKGSPSYEVGAAYGAPIVAGTAGFRLSAWFQSTGGFIDREDAFTGQILQHNANWSNSYVLRPAFSFVPTEGLTITPAIFIQHIHQNGLDTYWHDYLPDPESGAHVSGSRVPEPLTDSLRVPSLAIKYDFHGLSFQSDTSYLDREYTNIQDYTHTAEAVFSGGNPFIPGLAGFASYFDNINFTHAWQQEFRLSSQDTGARVNWVGGAYFRHAVQGMQQLIPPDLGPITEALAGQTSLQYFNGEQDYILKGQVLNSYTNFQTTDVQEAVFGEVTVIITSRLKTNVGVRVEHSVVEHQRQIVAGPLDGVTYSDVSLPDEVGNPVTPRFGVSYQYDDDGMVYGSAAKGYRAGGGNSNDAIGNSLCNASLDALGLTTVPGSFTSDSLWSYEVGVKDSLFDRRLFLQASAYRIDWSNIQTKVALPSCSESFTANRGKAVSRGFDLQVAAIVVEGLKLNASVGYTDAYYPDDALGAPRNGVVPLLHAAGDKLPNVLPWTAALHAEYSRDMSSLWSGAQSYLRVDYRWLSAAAALDPTVAGYDPHVGPYQNQAYGVLNVRLGVLHEGLDVSAYVLNATNSDPLLGYGHDTTKEPLYYSSAIRPMTVGFTALYHF